MLWCKWYEKPCKEIRETCIKENVQDHDFCKCKDCVCSIKEGVNNGK